jgi:hypothetical protein
VPSRVSALLVGALFLAVGALGFVPGVTTHYGDLSFAGRGRDAQLLGTFSVSILLNLVHLAFGIAGVALARRAPTARTYLLGGGAVSLAVWLIGVIGIGGWIPVNTADNWLHLVLGVGMIVLGPATA